MNPTTVMVDKDKEHAKTEDPHEDVGKLEKDGDKAVVMISTQEEETMTAFIQQALNSFKACNINVSVGLPGPDPNIRRYDY
ncbi:hypothetical protein Tco_0665328 [Tanacetum coccineum]